jgi:glutamate-1-semialdehyde 2,1-aminomutase
VSAAAAADTVIVPWNDGEAVAEAVERHEFAAIVAEPVPANMGVVPPHEGFLQLLRQSADRTGALLVFDEVISGFRVARGGAQERFGVTPDLSILGKVIGGGLPAAAYGGPRALMERIAPAGDVYQAGTLSGNPLAVAAALATLERLDGAAYDRLDHLTELLSDGLRSAASDMGVPLAVQSITGLATPFFTGGPVGNYDAAAACDLAAHGAWCRALLERGVYPPASQFEAWFPSLAHTEEDIQRTVQAAREAFAEVSR